jgi:histone-arginine methyltransferase CARM1
MAESQDRDRIYFSYYGQLQHQQNMLEDSIRTSAYQQAIVAHSSAFRDKVVLDVGAGSGILSFFAVQAGAKRVYAVEASAAARSAEHLVRANGLSDKIIVLQGKIEEIDLPEPVDIIISEPMGVLLLHERMIESFLYARDKFMRPGSGVKMFPSAGTIFLAPFTDGPTFTDLRHRSRFWQSRDFYGVDLVSLTKMAEGQIFSQPVVGGFDPKSLFCEPVERRISFERDPVSALLEVSMDLGLQMEFTGVLHGIAGWFDVEFGEEMERGVSLLSTAPDLPRTHWQQVRFFFREPIAVNRGQRLCGLFRMQVNDQRSYNVAIRGRLLSEENVDFGLGFDYEYGLHDQQYINLNPVAYSPDGAPEHLGLF